MQFVFEIAAKSQQSSGSSSGSSSRSGWICIKLTLLLQNISLPSHCSNSNRSSSIFLAVPQSNPPGCCFYSSRLAFYAALHAPCVRACVRRISLIVFVVLVCVCRVCLWCALKGKQFACSTVSLSVSQSVSQSDRVCVSERIATVICVSERANLTQSGFYSLHHIPFEYCILLHWHEVSNSCYLTMHAMGTTFHLQQ